MQIFEVNGISEDTLINLSKMTNFVITVFLYSRRWQVQIAISISENIKEISYTHSVKMSCSKGKILRGIV